MRSLMMEEFVSAKPERCEDNCPQRSGIADGGEFYIRPPEPLHGFLIKINNKN
jgi:hypothetical protein